MENTSTKQIKARRYYWTSGSPACGGLPAVESRRVYVTGFSDVEVGIRGSKEWPYRVERWCRVREDGEKVARILCHPSALHEEPQQ